MHSREDKVVAGKWEHLVAMGITPSDNPGQKMWVRKVTEVSGKSWQGDNSGVLELINDRGALNFQHTDIAHTLLYSPELSLKCD